MWTLLIQVLSQSQPCVTVWTLELGMASTEKCTDLEVFYFWNSSDQSTPPWINLALSHWSSPQKVTTQEQMIYTDTDIHVARYILVLLTSFKYDVMVLTWTPTLTSLTCFHQWVVNCLMWLPVRGVLQKFKGKSSPTIHLISSKTDQSNILLKCKNNKYNNKFS